MTPPVSNPASGRPARLSRKACWARLAGRVAVLGLTLEVSCRLGEYALSRLRDINYEPMSRVGLAPSQRHAIDKLIRGTSKYYMHSPLYGWTIRPGGEYGLYRANAQGLRGDREYNRQPHPDATRIACFGDSFTHGDDVANSNAWAALLDEAGDDIEVMNFGVGGFGVDQAYLRFVHEGLQFHHDIVLIGFMTRNIERHVNVFRPFLRPTTDMPMTKPRFHAEDGELRLIPNPLQAPREYQPMLENPKEFIQALRQYDFHARHVYHESSWDILATARLAKMARSSLLRGLAATHNGVFNRDAEPYIVTLLLLEKFVEHVAGIGATPVIVLFPDGADLRGVRAGEPLAYSPLQDDLRARGYHVIDVAEAFRAVEQSHRVKDLFDNGHYNAFGNRIVKDHILQSLTARGILAKKGQRAAAHLAPGASVARRP